MVMKETFNLKAYGFEQMIKPVTFMDLMFFRTCYYIDYLLLICLFHVNCCSAVCPPWCVTQQPACVCAAVWSCFTSWYWSILQQGTIWIRSTVSSSGVRPPPCLDTLSCCTGMEITAGLLYYLLFLILSLFSSARWSLVLILSCTVMYLATCLCVLISLLV